MNVWILTVEGEAGETGNVVGKESSHPDSHETFVQVGLSLVTLKARRSESVSLCAALLLGKQAPVA